MTLQSTVLVTGASGLLGRHLCSRVSLRGHRVLAQYHRHPPERQDRILPVYADLSTIQGLAGFWEAHRTELVKTEYFFSNYGPMCYKATEDLEFEDISEQITAHLAPLIFLVRRMRAEGCLRGVMVSGMAELEPGRGYRRIAAHACAKGVLETVLASWQLVWPDLFCHSWPVPTLEGARFPRPGRLARSAEEVAEEMVSKMVSGNKKESR